MGRSDFGCRPVRSREVLVSSPRREKSREKSQAMMVTGSHGAVGDVAAWLQSFDEQPATEAEVLDACVARAMGAMRCAEHVAILRVDDGRATTLTSTAGCPEALDEIGQRCGEGPDLTAAGQRDFVRVDDTVQERRWPGYCRQVTDQTPIRSLLVFPLSPAGGITATLSFYAGQPGAFDDAAVDLGSVLATHTSLVWQVLRRHEQFHSALASRDVIGQAKGMIMERFGIDAAQAFALLKRLSQESNRPLVDVARRLASREKLQR